MEMRRFGVGMGESGRALFRVLLPSPHAHPCPTLFILKTGHKTRSRPLAGAGGTRGGVKMPRCCVGALGTAPFTSQGWECSPLPPNRCALQGQLASSLLSLENR